MAEAISMTDQTMEQIRLLAHNLRPPVLDTFGLTTSLEGLCNEFGRRTNLEIEFEGAHLTELPEAVTISFYRFVQEALTNVAKHAQATRVKVELLEENNQLAVVVEDDGVGFSMEEPKNIVSERNGGIGLAGMQDRFELLSGWVEIDSKAGRGTRVTAYVPYWEER
jgi:two-component system NarL family sensor kinase